MSRGFVKEEDQEETPMVPPRAHLPDNVVNYVTPKGMKQLLIEKEELLKERENITIDNERERRITRNYINAKMELLEERIGTASPVNLDDQPKYEVRFGATVTLKINNEKETKQYQIVGVDESDIAKGKISFLSPIAKLLIGKKIDEKAILKLANKERTFEILKIEYSN